MSALRDAKAHLAKAQEFYDAAELSIDVDLYNAATSNAVASGINSKDAICLKLTGTTGKTDNHSDAVRELKAAGKAGQDVSSDFLRLLGSKAKSQYQAHDVAKPEAQAAIKRARRMLDKAREVVAA